MARIKYYDSTSASWKYADTNISSTGSVELDTTLTVEGKAADAKAVGDAISQLSGGNVDQVSIEPAEDDIPKIFFGGALQQTKDEKVVPFRYISKTDDFGGYAEIKAQGNTAMTFPKKNQTVKMFADEACEIKMKKDFKGWGKQNKHCYKANWIDLSHARNVVSSRLWADVVKSRANYADLPEPLRTSPNQGAVDGFPVKVYAAGVYQGRYTLNIPKDKWTFNMDDELEEHCVLYSENYVSGCFRAEAKIDESDWTDEIHDVVPESIKTRWNEVIRFVMNSTDAEFRANLGNYFDIPSLIDYYLFGLASCDLDGFGKNQIYMTYDGGLRWIASAYDKDSTWGLYWNGSNFVSTSYNRNEYEDFRSGSGGNLLYIRLEQLFWSELQTRWAELKKGALSIANIINRFERFTDIAPADLVKEDYADTTGDGKFVVIPSQSTNNIQQIRSFALARQAWTDEYVAGLTPEVEVPCTGISLDTNTLTFTAEGSQTLTATVTPDGCTDPVTWESNNTSVATVNGGVVTAIANGSATITAKCGEYSASCSVSVSGITEAVPCTGITLDKTELAFVGGGSQTLTATVTPSNTTDKIVWSSNNEDVATVLNGVITVVGAGECVITASCGIESATCAITVTMDNILESVAWESGLVAVPSGEALADSTWRRTVYFDFSAYAGMPLFLTGDYGKEIRMILYNSELNYIVGKGENSTTGVVITDNENSDNVKYARISAFATSGNVTLYAGLIGNLLSNPIEEKTGGYYNTDDGSFTTNANYSTRKIAVTAGDNMFFAGKIETGMFVDSSGTRISRIDLNMKSQTVEIPENAAFIHVNFKTANLDTCIVTKLAEIGSSQIAL